MSGEKINTKIIDHNFVGTLFTDFELFRIRFQKIIQKNWRLIALYEANILLRKLNS